MGNTVKAWVIGIVVVAALGLAGRVAFTLYDNHQTIKRLEVAEKLAKQERDAAIKANEASTATIERMEAQARLDAQTVTALNLAVTKVRQGATSTREIIREIERHDQDAADLLATPLPDGVRDALNRH